MGKVRKAGFAARVHELLQGEPELAAVSPLLAVRRALVQSLDQLEARLAAVAGASAVCRRLLSVPWGGAADGAGLLTAIDDPHRFRRSASVGAYLGLTPRRFESGETGYTGRIPKWATAWRGTCCSRPQQPDRPGQALVSAEGLGLSAGKDARGQEGACRPGKLAVILHRIWLDGSEFRWAGQSVAA